MVTEDFLKEQIMRIAEGYLSVTQKDTSGLSGLSITDYLELRKQVLWEYKKGIMVTQHNYMPQQQEQPQKPIERKTVSASIPEDKAYNITSISHRHEEKQNKELSVADKMKMLKDL